MRDRFTIFRSTFDAIMVFPAEDVKKILTMMGRYAMDDVLPGPEETAAYGMFLSIKPLIDTSNKRSEAGKKNQTASNPHQTASNPHQNASKCGNTETKIKEECRKIKQFIPPTREDLQNYVSERGLNIDIDRFLDYYTANGWMAGKVKMEDWKATVRNWSRSQRQEKTAEVKKPSTERKHDFDEIERMLFEASNDFINGGKL